LLAHRTVSAAQELNAHTDDARKDLPRDKQEPSVIVKRIAKEPIYVAFVNQPSTLSSVSANQPLTNIKHADPTINLGPSTSEEPYNQSVVHVSKDLYANKSESLEFMRSVYHQEEKVKEVSHTKSKDV